MTTVATTFMEIPQLLPLQRILLVGDDRRMQSRLQQLFESEGYAVDVANQGTWGQKLPHTPPPSVLVLDLQLAGGSPQRRFEQMRLAYASMPIIVLGTSSSAMEQVFFLELGADDYVVKPFHERELLARVRAAIRRSAGHPVNFFTFGDVQVDFRKMEVKRQSRPIPLTAQEFKVLKFMIGNCDRVISREELLNEVWGYHSYPTTRTVDNHICKLRQKLEPEPSDPVHFLTIHCVGYRFVA